MATWPVTLPVPSNEGYQISPGDQTIRTDMEAGAPRVRRKTTVRDDRLSVTWILTDAQLDTLRDWFDDAVSGIAGGSAWFSTSLAVGGNTLIETKEARFVGPFAAARLGLHWRVSATLEVR